MHPVKRYLLFLVCFGSAWVSVVEASGRAISAADCSLSAVRKAIDAATSGDTVYIPAGTCTWTSELAVAKGISLLGAGIDVTTLVDGVPKDGAAISLIRFDVDAPERFRLGNLTIQGLASNPNGTNLGHVRAHGSSKAFRIHHVKFVDQKTSAIYVNGDLWGVIDHCEFNKSFKNGIHINHWSWGGSTYGDGSWAEPLYLGTEKAVYIEDNVFNELSSIPGSVNDCLDGGRFVFRHNRVYNDYLQNHGTDTGQRRRSCRSFEIYNNTFTNMTAGGGQWTFANYLRGGSGVIFNNTFQNPSPCNGCPDSGYSYMVSLNVFRHTVMSSTPWGACDGSSPYDQNAAGLAGYRCVDQPGAGQSDHLQGVDVPLARWVGNGLDPIYAWANTFGTTLSPQIASTSSRVQVNRDYYNNVPRPGYVPYVYPHPLVSSWGAPDAPANVRIVK
jgi:hypothetical protein